MKINYNGKDVELKYTFNSFRYMKNFNINELAEVESGPFNIPELTFQMLIGAINCEPTNKYDEEDVRKFAEELLEKGELVQLFVQLSEMLLNSSFFTNLQKMEENMSKKKTTKK